MLEVRIAYLVKRIAYLEALILRPCSGQVIKSGAINKSKPQMRKVSMRTMSSENVITIRSGSPARPAASRFRRAFVWPILTRPLIRAIQPSSPLQIEVKAFSYGLNMICLGARNLTQNKRKFFNLNCIPRRSRKIVRVPRGTNFPPLPVPNFCLCPNDFFLQTAPRP